MIAAVVLATLVLAGAWLLAIALGRAAATGDRQMRDAAARKRGDVVDLTARRNLRALGRAVERHPSGGGRS